MGLAQSSQRRVDTEEIHDHTEKEENSNDVPADKNKELDDDKEYTKWRSEQVTFSPVAGVQGGAWRRTWDHPRRPAHGGAVTVEHDARAGYGEQLRHDGIFGHRAPMTGAEELQVGSTTHIFVIRSGESSRVSEAMLVGGRCAGATLTALGQRQAQALGRSLLSHGIRFHAIFSSPLQRCKQTATRVCQELNFSQERLQFAEALSEISNGLWEDMRKTDVYSREMLEIMSNLSPDFHAPLGESQRHVEFRMIEFLNSYVLPKPMDIIHHKDARLYYLQDTKMTSPIVQVNTRSIIQNASNTLVKDKGKVRSDMSFPSSIGTTSHVGDAILEQVTPSLMHSLPPYNVALFSHNMAIKCLLRGVMGFPSHFIDHLCIDHTSITLLSHSTYFGWKILYLNDTSHLRSI